MSETDSFEERLRQSVQPELEIIRLLGRGATSVVYLAREAALRRLVAVKALKPELSVDDVVRKRFAREAQSAARISHGNVTSVYRVGALDDGLPFIVMEYVDGRTLAATLDASGPLALTEARQVLGAVASALAAAHEHGIVHRDVRPANVFVENRTGRAVLADFGIAAFLESGSEVVTRLTAAGTRVGQLKYMSPEQINGDSATEQSDVYAFGILAYEALCGRGPYDAKRMADIASAHLRESPIPLQRLRADVEPGLANLVERCLTKDPQRRPRVAEIAKLLSGPPDQPVPTATVATRSPLVHFLAELKRRHVYKITFGYLVILVGGLQVVDALPGPDWKVNAWLVVGVAGMPIALVLSWIYDITAGGIQRTAAGNAQPTGWLSRSLPWIALVVVVILEVLFALWWMRWRA